MICGPLFFTSKFLGLCVGAKYQLVPVDGDFMKRVDPQDCINAHLAASKVSGGFHQLVTVRIHCARWKAANRRQKSGYKTCRGVTATVSLDQKLYTCKWSQINQ